MKSTTRPWAMFALGLLAAAAAFPAHPQASPSELQESQRRERPRLQVHVNLVNILASVVDSHRRPVPDLPKEAFEVYEEAVKQKIELFEPETNQALDLALMIDTSLSTVKELKFEREAAADFLRQVVRPGDGVAVFEFADAVTQLADFSSDILALEDAVRHMEPGAGTALYDAVYLGARALEKRPLERRRVIVLLTDAGETTSRADFDTARRAAVRSAAMLYTVLIRPIKTESGRNTAGEHALETITEVTGGAMYSLDSVDQLGATFDRINRELRTQYRLGYYPHPEPPSGSFRHVEVRVKGEGYFVHHRKGYFGAGVPE